MTDYFRYAILLTLLGGVFVAGCSTPGSTGTYRLIPVGELPQEIRSSPRLVQQSYQFAVANPEVLKEIPCYCGCGGMGHTSNYSCYVAGEKSNGDLVFDGHALGCSICVDITQDTMRMLDQGKSVSAIKLEIDEIYSEFGPSNMP